MSDFDRKMGVFADSKKDLRRIGQQLMRSLEIQVDDDGNKNRDAEHSEFFRRILDIAKRADRAVRDQALDLPWTTTLWASMFAFGKLSRCISDNAGMLIVHKDAFLAEAHDIASYLARVEGLASPTDCEGGEDPHSLKPALQAAQRVERNIPSVNGYIIDWDEPAHAAASVYSEFKSIMGFKLEDKGVGPDLDRLRRAIPSMIARIRRAYIFFSVDHP